MDSITDGDCDDEDENINPDAEEVPGDGIDNDCEGGDDPLGVNWLLEIIITEIMNNPSSVADENGEWFEVYNNTSDELVLDGLIVPMTQALNPSLLLVFPFLQNLQ